MQNHQTLLTISFPRSECGIWDALGFSTWNILLLQGEVSPALCTAWPWTAVTYTWRWTSPSTTLDSLELIQNFRGETEDFKQKEFIWGHFGFENWYFLHTCIIVVFILFNSCARMVSLNSWRLESGIYRHWCVFGSIRWFGFVTKVAHIFYSVEDYVRS